MKYATDYYALNKVGRPVKMCGSIEADTREEADEIAERLGHTIIGWNLTEEDAGPELSGLIDGWEKMELERDEAWLKGRGDGHKGKI